LKQRLSRTLARAESRSAEYSVPYANAVNQSQLSPLIPLPPVIAIVEEVPSATPDKK
jgi:hypothetical protein